MNAGVLPGMGDAAAAETLTGRWSGTVILTSSGGWDYTIGYRGEPERHSQGNSAHQLSWTITLDALRGNSEFIEFVNEDGSVALTQFDWSGSAANAGQNECDYAASGSMAGSSNGLTFSGLESSGVPIIGLDDSAVIPLTLSKSACGPDITFGFSGPNAATLWDGGGYDVLLFNRADYGPSYPPRFSLCSGPVTLDSVPAPHIDTAGHAVVQATVTGSCSDRRVEWFGDSDVYHDSVVGLTYTYDLTFQPDAQSCSDGLDNDGDGAIDVGGDPGCDSAADVSEYGAAECDNGRDDDGNGLVDFRANGAGDPGCESLTDTTELGDDCNGGTRGYTTRDYRGKVPGFDLFTFSPAVRYRFTATCAEILQGNTFGATGFNFATLALGVFGGFEGQYDVNNERFGVPVTKVDISGGHDLLNPPIATLSGEFDVTFDWAGFVTARLPVKKVLASKPIRKLTTRVQQIIDETLDKACSKAPDTCFEQLSAQQAQKLWRNIYGAMTGNKVGYTLALEDALEKFVNARGPLKQLRRLIARSVYRVVDRVLVRIDTPPVPQAFLDGKVRARGYGKKAVKGFIRLIAERVSKAANHPFSVWSPDVHVTVLPGGTVSYSLDGWRNPFLATEVIPGSERNTQGHAR